MMTDTKLNLMTKMLRISQSSTLSFIQLLVLQGIPMRETMTILKEFQFKSRVVLAVRKRRNS